MVKQLESCTNSWTARKLAEQTAHDSNNMIVGQMIYRSIQSRYIVLQVRFLYGSKCCVLALCSQQKFSFCINVTTCIGYLVVYTRASGPLFRKSKCIWLLEANITVQFMCLVTLVLQLFEMHNSCYH